MNSVPELPRTVGLSSRFPTPFMLLRSLKAAFALPILAASFLATFGCLLLGIPGPAQAVQSGARLLNDYLLSAGASFGPLVSDVLNWPDALGFYSRLDSSSVSSSVSSSGLLPWLYSLCGLESGSLFGYYLGIALSVLIWTFFGLAIQRITAVRLTTGDSRSLYRGLKWAKKKYAAFWGAVAMLAATIGLFCLVPWLGINIPYLNYWLFPIWFFLTLLGLCGVVGTIFSAPFVGSSLVSENGDAFDAASRSFSYASQNPLCFAGCLFWAFFWGAAGIWILAAVLKIGLFVAGVLGGLENATLGTNNSVLQFWIFCLNRIPEVALNAYLFTASMGAYLILRFRVDDIELDEVYLSTPYGLPRHQLPDLIQNNDTNG